MEEVIYKDLGMIDYAECWERQRNLFDALLKGKRENRPAEQYLLLCEHPAVYTLGKSGSETNLLVDESFLRNRGAAFYRIDRGGDITFHGPGQVVGYPILDLEREKIGLKDYIHALEQAIIDTAAEFGVVCGRCESAAGVWLHNGSEWRKICAIGVRSSRFVTMHGFALNVNTDLSWFDLINPCGFRDRGTTSLARETGTTINLEEVKRRLVIQLGKNIDVKIKYIEDYAD